jgi:integrase/recombinase XerD
MGARNNVLFVTYQGQGFSSNGLYKMLEKYLRLAGIKRQITIHSLRHTFAVHMLRNGTDIRYIQEILGHSSYHTSFHYTRVLSGHLKVMYKEHHPFENQLFEDVEKANSKYLEKIADAISKGARLW